MKKTVWLDLEDTVITSWDEGLLINTMRVRTWLESNSISDVHIWSFAIYNDNDKVFFIKSGMKEYLERALGVTIHEFPSVSEMRSLITLKERFKYESDIEFMQFNGKDWSFMRYCKHYHPNEHCVLIDDSVETMLVQRQNGFIEFINITHI